jgi:hypothetical protein
LGSVGFPCVWDSMEGLKSQTPADDLLGAIQQVCASRLDRKAPITSAF